MTAKSETGADSRRCCAMLYNRKTRKSRQCSAMVAKPEFFCAKHAPAMKLADEINRAAIEAEKNYDHRAALNAECDE